MNFIMLREDQSRFHLGSVLITLASLKSGIQNPVFNSLFSASVRCNKTSSFFDGGRPLRRSCCNCSISGTLRLICLQDGIDQQVSTVKRLKITPSIY